MASFENVFPSPLLEMGSVALILFIVFRGPYTRWQVRKRNREVDELMGTIKEAAIYVGPVTPEMRRAIEKEKSNG